jgi:hypothetical protein
MLKFNFAEGAAICDGRPVVYACIAKPVLATIQNSSIDDHISTNAADFILRHIILQIISLLLPFARLPVHVHLHRHG